MKNRNLIDISARILESANTPISKTWLMYRTYLSDEQITSFTTILIKNDLLSFDNHARLFCTTAKGRKFLELECSSNICVDFKE